MAATLYTYGNTQMIADLKAALNAKGLITSVLYENTTNLIFSTPLTSKVIRVYIINDGNPTFQMYYADSWTSGTTLVNGVIFSTVATANDYVISGINVVADTTFFALTLKMGATDQYGFGYVGQLTNGNTFLFGLGQGSLNNIAKDFTLGINLFPISLTTTTGIKDASGNLFTMPLMWTDAAGTLQMNGTNIAEVVGVKLSSSIFCGPVAVYQGTNYFLTPTNLDFLNNQIFQTSLLLEFTP